MREFFTTFLTFNPAIAPVEQLRRIDDFFLIASRDLPASVEEYRDTRGQILGAAYKDAVLANLAQAPDVSNRSEEEQEAFRQQTAALNRAGPLLAQYVPTVENNSFAKIIFSGKSHEQQVAAIVKALVFNPDQPDEAGKRRQEFCEMRDQVRFELMYFAAAGSRVNEQEYFKCVPETLAEGLRKSIALDLAQTVDIVGQNGGAPDEMWDHNESLNEIACHISRQQAEFGAIARLFPAEPETGLTGTFSPLADRRPRDQEVGPQPVITLIQNTSTLKM
jgi:hypothetical protein